MYIIPMSGITPLNTISQAPQKAASEQTETGASFADVFKNAFKTAEETQSISEQDSIKAALGEIDDLHTVSLNAKKAAIALETFVALKNTAVESYKEIMSISL